MPNTFYHGDTAITANEQGQTTSSVYLYEPFGQAAPSSTFGTNSNPTNATDQSMGWASNPTRKVAGAFTIPIIQMGARVYLPTAGRFLQVDPVEGGVANAYVYVADPINGNDYSGLCAYVIQCTATANYLQPAATVTHVQPAASGTRVQRTSTRPLQAKKARKTSTFADFIAPPTGRAAYLKPASVKGVGMSTIPVSSTLTAGGPGSAPAPIKKWDWYGAAAGADGWASGGALVGGIVGCGIGGVGGAIAGFAVAGVGAFPGAAVGCVSCGAVGSRAGAVGGAGAGAYLGGADNELAGFFDWMPSVMITPW